MLYATVLIVEYACSNENAQFIVLWKPTKYSLQVSCMNDIASSLEVPSRNTQQCSLSISRDAH